jgi:hypothetical protein
MYKEMSHKIAKSAKKNFDFYFMDRGSRVATINADTVGFLQKPSRPSPARNYQ